MTQQRKTRTFTMERAVRKQVPLIGGVTGPSGGGKTYSGLRLATGMAKVFGGGIVGIDTENKRLLHYADTFKFDYVAFPPPHSPLDYLDVIADAIAKRPKAVIFIDSMSQEHIGDGGVLEMHAKVVNEKGMNWSQIAWKEPKAQRRTLLNYIVQNVMCCVMTFKAKENYDFNAKPAVNLGYMPLGGEEIVFDLMFNALLLESAMGVPTWNPQEKGAKKMVKIPEQFRNLLLSHKGPLDERLGEEMAKWAMGGSVAKQDDSQPDKPAATETPFPQQEPSRPKAEPLTDADARMALKSCKSIEELADLWQNRLTNDQKTLLVAVKDQRKEDLQLMADASGDAQ